MDRPFRWEINVGTGERTRVELTDDEIAEAQARKVARDAVIAAREIVEQHRAARQAKLDALLDKIEADPTILERIK